MILVKFTAPEIKGQSHVDGHTDWIEVDSMHWGVGRAVTFNGGKRDVNSPSVSEVTFSRASDIASPELFFQSCGGPGSGKCLIHVLQVVENRPQVYLTIELEGALISNYSISSGGDRPSDSFSVNFTKISFQYDNYDGKKVTTGTAKKWDLAANVTF